jgi:hypothetical protein
MFNYGITKVGINWVVVRRYSHGLMGYFPAPEVAVTTSLEAAAAVLRLMEVS